MSLQEAVQWLMNNRDKDIEGINEQFDTAKDKFESLELSLSKALSRIKVLEKKNAEFEVFGNENDT